MKDTPDRFLPHVISLMREEIQQSAGNEVLFIAHLDDNQKIASVDVASHGDAVSVPALTSWLERGDIVIHNHPSGLLKPSKADLEIASHLGNHGFGFYIINNEVSLYYSVAEPAYCQPIKPLEKRKLLDALEPDGPLSKIFQNYEYRESQVEMVSLISDAFNENKIAVAEAGTGVGKSLAYLLPAIEWAITNDEKVVISTATINLQQQIYEKDLPLAMEVLGKEVKSVLVKGRGNFICLRRLEQQMSELSLFEEENEELEVLNEWAGGCKEGCQSELSFKVSKANWNRVNSESDNCYGLRCKYREECFVLKMKKKAASSHLLVANHHLVFADIAYRSMGAGYEQAAVLPHFKKIIFDEAHNMENNATGFFSLSFNRFSLLKTISRLVNRNRSGYSGLINDLKKINLKKELIVDLPILSEALLLAMDKVDGYGIAIPDENPRATTLRYCYETLNSYQKKFLEYLQDFSVKVNQLYNRLGTIKKEIPQEDQKENFVGTEITVLLSRLSEVASICNFFLHMNEHPDYVFYTKKEKSSKNDFFLNIVAAPIDISKKLQESLFEPIDTVVCTSATLSVGKSFDFFLKRTGIHFIEKDRLLIKSFPSPFPYHTNVLLQIPFDGPFPDAPIYLKYVQRYTYRALEMSEGRGLVLFTSIDMLEKVYDYCAPLLTELGITCFKQGDFDSALLLTKFKNDIHSVLFATNSFWQGVDSPGETLSIVIITKLPFSVPTDPLSQARHEAINASGKNAFFEMDLPEAVMKLKQGFGRLIRSKEDRGVVSILDTRIIKKSYGAIFLESLPETKRSITEGKNMMADLEQFLF